jgi:hypothetical protein
MNHLFMARWAVIDTTPLSRIGFDKFSFFIICKGVENLFAHPVCASSRSSQH